MSIVFEWVLSKRDRLSQRTVSRIYLIYLHKIQKIISKSNLTLQFFFISPKYELPTVQRDHDGPEDEGIQKHHSMENEVIYNIYIF